MRVLLRVAAAALLLALVANPATAQTPFFQGKQLKVLVGFPPGGGSDLFARVSPTGSRDMSRASPPSWCRTSPAPAASSR